MRRFLIIILLSVITLPTVGLATPEDDFEHGKNAYLYGDFRKVIEFLDPLVGTEGSEKLDPRKQADALEWLGLSLYYLGQETRAKDIFHRLILTDLDRTLDPITAPPDVVAVYDKMQADLKVEIDRLKREAEKKRRAKEAQVPVREIDRRRNSKWVTLVPFGVGQFQNGDNGWGGFFLGTELVAVSLSTIFFFAAQDLRQPDGFFVGADATLARNLRTAQFVSGGTALALMVGGAIHAAVTFKPLTETRREVIKPTLSPAGAGILIEF